MHRHRVARGEPGAVGLAGCNGVEDGVPGVGEVRVDLVHEVVSPSSLLMRRTRGSATGAGSPLLSTRRRHRLSTAFSTGCAPGSAPGRRRVTSGRTQWRSGDTDTETRPGRR